MSASGLLAVRLSTSIACPPGIRHRRQRSLVLGANGNARGTASRVAAQRRERARIRSERQQRWGRPKPKAA
jgi:hypothetical protein